MFKYIGGAFYSISQQALHTVALLIALLIENILGFFSVRILTLTSQKIIIKLVLKYNYKRPLF